MNAFFKPFVLAWYALRLPWLKRRYRRLVIEEIDGVPLMVLPDVFNPLLLRTGAFLARALNAWPMLSDNALVLDMGTGSGVGAVFAARRGAQVVAVDINPEAVRCARINAMLNQLEDCIDVHHGDLMEPLDSQYDGAFDLVLFNPPFYIGKPRHHLDFAWRGEDVFERFAKGLSRVLKPRGQALVVFSSDGDWEPLEKAFVVHGFHTEVVEQLHYANEVLSAYRVARPSSLMAMT